MWENIMQRLILALATGAALSLAACPAQASEMSYFTTVTNTDVATFGLGYMRNIGTGNLEVSGLSGTISQAYLFWQGPTNSVDPLANAAVNFGGSAITGANIGFSASNGWSTTNSQAYRADVTSIISATGNGIYALADFVKPTANINGLSLIVFFDDGNAANNQDVVLFNGNDSNDTNSYDISNWNAALNGVNYASGGAELVLHVADGQTLLDGTLTFNGSTLGTDTMFRGDGIQFGNGNFPSNGALWDIETYDISSLVATNNALSLNAVSDAVGLIVAQFNLPVGAAPAVPEPATWAMMIGGFALIGASLRRQARTIRFA
jgi:hypothetical protein